nr:helix-turn-helix transcriptional regulator [Micromonospora sp. DSM 115978]
MRELRRRRVAAGLSQKVLAERCFTSDTHVSGVETGTRPVTRKYLVLVDAALGLGDYFQTMWDELVKDGDAPIWLREWIEIERMALALRWYELSWIPGLLQTEAYARSTLANELLTPEEVDRLVETRMGRQSILTRDRPPMLFAVIDETALYRRHHAEDTALMEEQLAHLRKSAELPHVNIHVVPTSAGRYPGLGGPFIIAETPERELIGHVDSQLPPQIVYRADDVGILSGRWERIRSNALPERGSLDLIEKAATSWT